MSKVKSQPIHVGKGMAGEYCLLAAVIAQAANDAAGRGGGEFVADARRYFAGELYDEHLDWLGLPSDWLPSLEALTGG